MRYLLILQIGCLAGCTISNPDAEAGAALDGGSTMDGSSGTDGRVIVDLGGNPAVDQGVFGDAAIVDLAAAAVTDLAQPQTCSAGADIVVDGNQTLAATQTVDIAANGTGNFIVAYPTSGTSVFAAMIDRSGPDPIALAPLDLFDAKAKPTSMVRVARTASTSVAFMLAWNGGGKSNQFQIKLADKNLKAVTFEMDGANCGNDPVVSLGVAQALGADAPAGGFAICDTKSLPQMWQLTSANNWMTIDASPYPRFEVRLRSQAKATFIADIQGGGSIHAGVYDLSKADKPGSPPTVTASAGAPAGTGAYGMGFDVLTTNSDNSGTGMVAWIASVNGVAQVQYAVSTIGAGAVQVPARALAVIPAHPGTGATPVGVSAADKFFLVGYTIAGNKGDEAHVQMVDGTGAVIGKPLRVGDGAFPQVAWDAQTASFGVSWVGADKHPHFSTVRCNP